MKSFQKWKVTILKRHWLRTPSAHDIRSLLTPRAGWALTEIDGWINGLPSFISQCALMTDINSEISAIHLGFRMGLVTEEPASGPSFEAKERVNAAKVPLKSQGGIKYGWKLVTHDSWNGFSFGRDEEKESSEGFWKASLMGKYGKCDCPLLCIVVRLVKSSASGLYKKPQSESTHSALSALAGDSSNHLLNVTWKL